METAVDLIERIYAHPEGASGGPFHILIDDGNVTDGNLEFCITRAKKGDYPADLAALCLRLGDELTPMTEAQRMACVREVWDRQSRRPLVERLAAYPVGTVALDGREDAWQKGVSDLWHFAGHQVAYGSEELLVKHGPIRVIWQPS
jgi:hypothetical protein